MEFRGIPVVEKYAMYWSVRAVYKDSGNVETDFSDDRPVTEQLAEFHDSLLGTIAIEPIEFEVGAAIMRLYKEELEAEHDRQEHVKMADKFFHVQEANHD